MKNKLLLLMLSASVLSCNSDDVVGNKNLSEESALTVTSSSNFLPELRTFDLSNGENVEVLTFSSWQDFQELADILSNQVEIYDDNFLLENADLSEEELSILEEETEYTDQVPLINFENSISFNQALRKRFNLENEIMLETENLDSNIDPNVNLAFSNGELSLVNNNQEVMVGDTIYVFKDGNIGRIFDNYTDNLLTVRVSGLQVNVGMNIFESNQPAAECVGWRATESDHHYANGKNARRVAKVRAVPGWTKSEKMTINYEKGRRWREKRTKMALDLSVWLWEKCDSESNSQVGKSYKYGRNTLKDKKRRDIHHHEYITSGTVKTRKGFLVGNHHYAGTSTYYKLQ